MRKILNALAFCLNVLRPKNYLQIVLSFVITCIVFVPSVSLILVAGVVVHELGHALCYGRMPWGSVEIDIGMFCTGNCSFRTFAKMSQKEEAESCLAGPLFETIFSALLAAVWFCGGANFWGIGAYVSTVIGSYNLFSFPRTDGRCARLALRHPEKLDERLLPSTSKEILKMEITHYLLLGVSFLIIFSLMSSRELMLSFPKHITLVNLWNLFFH